MSNNFCHLHCHTEYSLLDSMNKIPDILDKAKDDGMPAVAITDHGALYGALNFYLEAKKRDIKPIIGCEVYVAPKHRKDKGNADVQSGYHLVLLAKNNKGLNNLLKIGSKAYFEGFYYKPRVDKDMLKEHSDGLIALSACLQGEVSVKYMKEGLESACETAKEYSKIFPNAFYLEMQANMIEDQKILNEGIGEISQRTGIPRVATNDCHYLNIEDKKAHDVLYCIQTNSNVYDDSRLFSAGELDFKTTKEMYQKINDKEALENTVKIADSCDVEFELDTYKYPVFPTTKSVDDDFADLARQGLEKRLKQGEILNVDQYRDRLEHEIKIITDMGFPGYFLIVQDFINWAKEQGIPVGPGRGSAAGSLVAYSLGITNIDPLPYNLLFERFLNPERISMPDIDVDFCERRREKVLHYVSEKYGEENVAQITTFGSMKAKGAIRDVGRAYGFTFQETDQIAKLVPDGKKIKEAIEIEPDLKSLYDNNDSIKELLDTSIKLEGLSRHASTHAAGVVIADKPLSEYTPLYKAKTGETVSQFDMNMIEKEGLIKFDFLGLRTMTTIQDTIDSIKKIEGKSLDLDTLSVDDVNTYKLFASGKTDGMFQVESKGMQDYLKKLGPNEFEDIIAMLALYRPGPLGSGMIDSYMQRRAGEEEVVYPLPELEETLRPTYGIIVYQEQVMEIARVMSGYSLGEADILRKAMGKKKPEEMAKQHDKFISGAKQNGFSEEKAEEIFALIEKFAEYGFNKSHSASYALISYWTGYFKTHYPIHFMASLLSNESENDEKVLRYIGTCKDLGIEILRPDINKSLKNFQVENKNGLRYGFGAIKGLGGEAINNIVEERNENGEYINFKDFCKRINTRKVNKKCIDALIWSGALDCFEVPRNRMSSALDEVIKITHKKNKNFIPGQGSLLSLLGEDEQENQIGGMGYETEFDNVPESDLRTILEKELETLGYFFSSNPLLDFQKEISERSDCISLEQTKDLEENTKVIIPCLQTQTKTMYDKNGNKMAFLDIKDMKGEGTAILFSKTYKKYENMIGDMLTPLVVVGNLGEEKFDKASIKVNQIFTLEEFLKQPPQKNNTKKENENNCQKRSKLFNNRDEDTEDSNDADNKETLKDHKNATNIESNKKANSSDSTNSASMSAKDKFKLKNKKRGQKKSEKPKKIYKNIVTFDPKNEMCNINIDCNEINFNQKMDELKQIFKNHSGERKACLWLNNFYYKEIPCDISMELGEDWKVNFTPDFQEEVNRWFAENKLEKKNNHIFEKKLSSQKTSENKSINSSKGSQEDCSCPPLEEDSNMVIGLSL